MVELPDHPYFVGCQFHPEFKSRPQSPAPLFRSFIAAALRARAERRRTPSASRHAPLGRSSQRLEPGHAGEREPRVQARGASQGTV